MSPASTAPRRYFSALFAAFTAAVLALSISSRVSAQGSPSSAADNPTASNPSGAAPTTAAPSTRVAPTVNECLAAHREAQSLRKQYRLRECRELLADCAHDACPAPVKRDCMRWTDDVALQIPSVVLRVDLGGAPPPSKAKIYVDGELMFESIPNRALELNPGTHQFRMTLEDGQSAQQEVTLGEGEKFKNVLLKFEAPATSSTTAGPTLPPTTGQTAPVAPPPGVEKRQPVSLATYIFAGLGAAAAINFGAWAIYSEKLRTELQNECAPNCEQEYIDRVRTRGYIADISLGVSVASFATAAVLYFTRPTVTVPGKIDVGILPHGGVIGTLRLKEF